MAKLQDTLEIFMEELEKVQVSINSVKDVTPTIDYKINEIKKLALKVEISNLESANQLFLKALGNEYLKIDENKKTIYFNYPEKNVEINYEPVKILYENSFLITLNT